MTARHLLLLGAICLTACSKPTTSAQSGGPAPGTSPTASSPAGGSSVTAALTPMCKLVTAADIEAATTVKVGASVADTRMTKAMVTACDYQHADTAQYGASMVASLAAIKAEKVSSEREVYEKFMKTDPVPGVGDGAWFNEMTGALFAVKGDKAVQVQVLDGPKRKDAAVKLAQLALSRL